MFSEMWTSPTKSEGDTISRAEDYRLKYAIKRAGPFMALPFILFGTYPCTSVPRGLPSSRVQPRGTISTSREELVFTPING